MTDPAGQLATLRGLRAAATDPAAQAALDAAIAALEAAARTHDQAIAGHSQVGAAVAGDVGRVVAPLFTGQAAGNYIAEVIHLYQQAPAAPQADYGAALRRYLKHLYDTYATLDLRGIDDRPMDMPLSELYVGLHLHEPPPDALRGRGGLRGFLETVRGARGLGADAHDVLETVRGVLGADAHDPQAVTWPVALRHPRLAVVGAPGSGKTTLLHYTAVRLAEVLARDDASQLADLGLGAADAAARPPVPLLLPLRELGAHLAECGPREAAAANPRLLLACLANVYARFDLDLPPDFFARLCDAGRAILLLDGLDEVARGADRAFVSAVVRNVAARYPGCRYVVTARVAAYQGDAQIGAGFRICTVADLDAKQQQGFIGNWSRSLHRLLYGLAGAALEQRAARYAADLWQALKANDRVRALATNPLLLTVVAVIFYNNYVLPEDRAALYEECVEVLLRGGRGKADRAAQQRAQFGGRPDLHMGLDPKRELLAAVAYAMHARGEAGVTVSRAELVALVAAHLRHRPDADAAARAFVDELPVHIGLLDEREPDRFRFSHLSFQEFLAARYIAETDRWDELLARYRATWWREVILLCAGHLSRARCWAFLERLIGQGPTPAEHAKALALAADALAELERFKGQGPLNAQIVRAALTIFEAPPLAVPAAARVACGRVLGQLGDPRPGVCDLPPALVPMAGGSFVIGNTPEEYQQIIADEQRNKRGDVVKSLYKDSVNTQPVTLAPFEIGRYPVTNAQYALFIADGGYDPDQPWWDAAGRAWLARDDAATEGLAFWQRRQRKDQPHLWEDKHHGQTRTNQPVVGISWYEAVAFCRWLTLHLRDGFIYRLPSEAEWEYAARGPERRTYPWGADAPDAERANYNRTYDGPTAVGSFPRGATPEGVHDLVGTMWEWTGSVYAPYPYDPHDGREQPDSLAQQRLTLRGGGWIYRSLLLRASNRFPTTPDYQRTYVGVRLARHLPE